MEEENNHIENSYLIKLKERNITEDILRDLDEREVDTIVSEIEKEDPIQRILLKKFILNHYTIRKTNHGNQEEKEFIKPEKKLLHMVQFLRYHENIENISGEEWNRNIHQLNGLAIILMKEKYGIHDYDQLLKMKYVEQRRNHNRRRSDILLFRTIDIDVLNQAFFVFFNHIKMNTQNIPDYEMYEDQNHKDEKDPYHASPNNNTIASSNISDDEGNNDTNNAAYYLDDYDHDNPIDVMIFVTNENFIPFAKKVNDYFKNNDDENHPPLNCRIQLIYNHNQFLEQLDRIKKEGKKNLPLKLHHGKSKIN